MPTPRWVISKIIFCPASFATGSSNWRNSSFTKLFHTIFFVKDQVKLNENLANYFGQQLAVEFFHDRPQEIIRRRERMRKMRELRKQLVELARWYGQNLADDPPDSREAADQRLSQFVAQKLWPTAKEVCRREEIAPCWAAVRKWNNASLSAYLTYQDKMIAIERLHRSLGFSLKEFFDYLARANSKGEQLKGLFEKLPQVPLE